MNTPELLAELNGRGVRLTSHGDRLAYDAPAGVMTADLAERVKACKPELLAMLADRPEPADGGQLETHADRETRRFLAVCRPWLDGRGWYDPAQAPTAEALARADDSSQPPPTHTGRQPDLYDRSGGGVETFTERATRYLRECNGLPPGASRRPDDSCIIHKHEVH